MNCCTVPLAAARSRAPTPGEMTALLARIAERHFAEHGAPAAEFRKYLRSAIVAADELERLTRRVNEGDPLEAFTAAVELAVGALYALGHLPCLGDVDLAEWDQYLRGRVGGDE